MLCNVCIICLISLPYLTNVCICMMLVVFLAHCLLNTPAICAGEANVDRNSLWIRIEVGGWNNWSYTRQGELFGSWFGTHFCICLLLNVTCDVMRSGIYYLVGCTVYLWVMCKLIIGFLALFASIQQWRLGVCCVTFNSCKLVALHDHQHYHLM